MLGMPTILCTQFNNQPTIHVYIGLQHSSTPHRGMEAGPWGAVGAGTIIRYLYSARSTDTLHVQWTRRLDCLPYLRDARIYGRAAVLRSRIQYTATYTCTLLPWTR
jgi:hypothetical protein